MNPRCEFFWVVRTDFFLSPEDVDHLVAFGCATPDAEFLLDWRAAIAAGLTSFTLDREQVGTICEILEQPGSRQMLVDIFRDAYKFMNTHPEQR